MRRTSVIVLLLIFSGLVAAQIPSSAPSTTQADTQPAVATTVAATLPDTLPSTLPVTMPVASTGPTSNFSSTTSTGTASTEASVRSYEPRDSSSSRSHKTHHDSRSSTPSSPPVESNGPQLAAKPITKEFYPVLSRSIFIKGRQEVFERDTSIRYRPPEPATQVASTEPTTAPAPWTPESTLVFNGASDADGQLVAFIENSALNTIGRFHLGEAVAQGKVAAITLDSLDYQAGTRVTHVMLGQNLQGIDMQVLTTQPVSSTTTPTGSATTQDSSGSGGAPDSVLERLRLRRLKELGQ